MQKPVVKFKTDKELRKFLRQAEKSKKEGVKEIGSESNKG